MELKAFTKQWREYIVIDDDDLLFQVTCNLQHTG